MDNERKHIKTGNTLLDYLEMNSLREVAQFMADNPDHENTLQLLEIIEMVQEQFEKGFQDETP